MEIKFVILGEPASKANARRVFRHGNRMIFAKSAKALKYLSMFRAQCPKLPTLLEGDLAVSVRVFYGSRRPDLDISVILDAMQGYIYANDRAVKEQHIYWDLDRDNPRAEIRVAHASPPSKDHSISAPRSHYWQEQ